MILITAATIRFLNPALIRPKSFVAVPKPTPIMGPMIGEISMAPMVTAVEFTFDQPRRP